MDAIRLNIVKSKAATFLLFSLCFSDFSTGVASTIETQGSRLERIQGVWVMDLYGTREEMAKRHGELIRDKIEQTALPYFSDKIRHSIAQTYIIRDFPALALPFQSAIDLVIEEPLRNAIPREDARALDAFAEGVNLPPRRLYNGWILPDAGQWLTATLFGSNQIKKGFFGTFPIVPDWGCSSLIATSERSTDGLLHARNLDYEGYGIFDRATTLIRYHPSEPEAQDYISIGALGLHQAGITAMNQSGIILTLHQAMVDQVSLTGTPILSANERVIREAHSLQEAVALLSRMKHSGSWRILLSSALEDRALLIEVSTKGTFVVEDSRTSRPTAPQGLMLATNHVIAPELRKDEFSVNYRYAEDTRLRLRALQNLSQRRLQGTTGKFDLGSAIDAISSFEAFDDQGNSSMPTSHGIISKMNNIQSVVFEPARNQVWIATPPAEEPFAKPVQGKYISFPLFRTSMSPPTYAIREPSMVPTKARVRAHALFRQAAAISTEESQFLEAAKLYIQAGDQEPTEALYPLMAGLSLFQGEDFLRAHIQLERALQLQPDLYQQSVLHLFLGRISDIEGQRGDALIHYNQVKSEFSQALAKEAALGRRKPYRAKSAHQVVLDAVQADVLRW